MLGGVPHAFVALPNGKNGIVRTDGTAEGTTFVAETGGFSGQIPPFVFGQSISLWEDGGVLFYGGTGGSIFFDGSPGGVRYMPPLAPAPVTSAAVGSLGGRVIFVAQAAGTATMYSLDRATEVYTPLGTFPATSNMPWRGSAKVPGRVVFGTEATGGVQQIWSSNGVDLVLLATLAEPGGVDPAITRFADKALFRGRAAGGGGALWITDGTAAGTSILQSLAQMPEPGGAFLNHEGVAYFRLGQDLWRTDGSAAGTTSLFAGPPPPGISNFAPSFAWKGAVWGITFVSPGTRGLYRVDANGLQAAFLSQDLQDRPSFVDVGTGFFVFASEFTIGETAFTMVSDGTAAGTRKVDWFAKQALLPLGAGSFLLSTPAGRPSNLYRMDLTGAIAGPAISWRVPINRQYERAFAVGDGWAYFLNREPGLRSLWRLAASGNAETVTAASFASGVNHVVDVAPLGSDLLIGVLPNGPFSYGLWRLDPVTGVAASVPGTSTAAYSKGIPWAGGVAYLSGSGFSPSGGLHRMIPGESGPALLASNTRALNSASRDRLAATSGGIVWLGLDGSFYYVYRWDGSSTTPSLVRIIATSTILASPVRSVGGFAVFLSRRSSDGRLQLWRSDGTAGGTVVDCTFGAGSEETFEVVQSPYGPRAYFVADDGVAGLELMAWSPGSGCSLVGDPAPGRRGSGPRFLGALPNGSALFLAQMAGGRWGVWRTFGVPGDAALLAEAADVAPAQSFFPNQRVPAGMLVRGGTALLFGFGDPTTGVEPWISDGTVAGTYALEEIMPGPLSSDPRPIATMGRWAYVEAYTAAAGRELMAWDQRRTTAIGTLFPGGGAAPAGR
jgi:ELWxxDGT repeat protein